MQHVLRELDIENLRETYDLEVKRALGRDGGGKVPSSFWETYSAMANTEGGVVLLGVEEPRPGEFKAVGLTDPSKVVKALWDGANDRNRVSSNLLSNNGIEAYDLGAGQTVLSIRVPRARRDQKPVHVGDNPFTGSYRRGFEGDYRCDDETVRRMLAERVEDARDSRFLEGFFIKDLDLDSVQSYRNLMASTKPGHPWLELDNREFLRSLQVWRRDRVSHESSLTLAGLLMFGRLPAILEALPNYVLDYQERPEPKTELRWIDRVTTDGTWSGNVFDFYRLVSKRLFSDLKVPFRMLGEQRVDDTPVHRALREALVNALIHADYSGRVSVLAVKRPDLFGFRNPGLMRLPIEEAIQGGVSDCRNRILQKMFQLVGLGEQAGSGIPRIFKDWTGQHWRAPSLEERREPDQTLMTLRMTSLLPDDVVTSLDERFGDSFRQLSATQRLALATAFIEGQVTHSRLSSITADHPHDLTQALRSLVEGGFLESRGATRATRYLLPGATLSSESDILGSIPESFEDLSRSSEDLSRNSDILEAARGFAAPIRATGKARREDVRDAILRICSLDFWSLRELADLLGRKQVTLRQGYISEMVRDGVLQQRYPSTNHPRQAYRASGSAKNSLAAKTEL